MKDESSVSGRHVEKVELVSLDRDLVPKAEIWAIK